MEGDSSDRSRPGSTGSPASGGAWEWHEPTVSPQREGSVASTVVTGEHAAPLPAAEPGIGRTRLRERTFGEILDDTFGIYKEHWRLLLLLSALVMVPIQVVNFPLDAFIRSRVESMNGGGSFGDSDVGTLALTSLGSVVVTSLAMVFLRGAVARLVSELCLGRAPSVREAASFAWTRFGRLLCVWILFSFLLGLGIIPGVLLLFVPYFVFLASFQFAPVAVVVEGAAPRQALKRSWHLSKGFRWKVLGTVAIVFLIKLIAVVVVSFPLGFLGGVVGAVSGQAAISDLVSSVAGAIAGTLTAPALTVAVTLLYFDLRVRKEAFDLTVMARELSVSPA